jgi:peptidoglycan/xylan/chitin deacetylase (PgdA/CDA1 family)
MLKVFLRTFFLLLALILAFILISKSLPLPGTIPVLQYRAIGAAQDAKDFKHFISRQSFTTQMAFLKFLDFRILSMAEYEKILSGEKKSRGREILLTFDSGDISFEQEAWPILRRYNFPVTLFLVSESMRRESNNSMAPEAIDELVKSGLVTLGSNGRTHASLPALNEVQLGNEVKGSKEDLEEFFDVPVEYFAYPNGDLNAESIAAVKKAGYRLAFTTSHHKLNGLTETPFSLTRMNISLSSDNPIVFWVKITGIYQVHKHYWYRLKSWAASLRPAS